MGGTVVPAGATFRIWGHYTKRKKLYAKRPPLFVLTPGSFILGSLDDVMAFADSVVTIFPLAQRQEIWNSVWNARATRLGYC